MVERAYLINLVSFAVSTLPVVAIVVLMLASLVELRRLRPLKEARIRDGGQLQEKTRCTQRVYR
jgi:hypothetical protein